MAGGDAIFEPFRYAGGGLRCGPVAVGELTERFGTPLYVYSAEGIRARFEGLRGAFAAFRPEIHFAAKSCGNLHILRMLVGLGSGIDVVSGGELERAWLAGCPMERVAFAGVGKTEEEIRAAVDGRFSPLRDSDIGGRAGAGEAAARGTVGLINVESVEELGRVDRIARELGRAVRVALRVNPDVDARTHPYTTTGRRRNKFGIELSTAEGAYARAVREDGAAGAHPVGLHVHIGSPVYEIEPFVRAAESIVAAAGRLRAAGARVDLLDMGGGWPSAYRPEQVRDLGEFARALEPVLGPEVERGTRVALEPGRSIVANAGVLLTRVQYVKRASARRFVIADAGMHTLLRPALYQAEHAIWPVAAGAGPFADGAAAACVEPVADVVGPICETGDFLARDRALPELGQGDLLAVFGAGAYGMSMASTYNEHPRPAEVLVEGDGARLIRRRETAAELIEHELGL
jgi:diaminopimelate decarboxylase